MSNLRDRIATEHTVNAGVMDGQWQVRVCASEIRTFENAATNVPEG